MLDYSEIDISICTLGAFGAKYVRDGETLPSRIEITKGSIAELKVKHIHSEIPLGTVL